jgi:hypothetical protein
MSAQGSVRYYLIAEQQPDQAGWNWIVWRPGLPAATVRHGIAPTLLNAMRTAQTVANRWDAGHVDE